MLKLFDNVKALAFASHGRSITGMSSSEGESFDLAAARTAEGPVEAWTIAVEHDMIRYTLTGLHIT